MGRRKPDMSVFKIVAWFRGHVVVKVTGGRLNEVISNASFSDIQLWDVQNVTTGFVVVSIYVSDYRAFCEMARKCGCRTTVIDRFGLPFLLNRLKKRWALAIGLVLFVAGLYVLSSLVWRIEITGLEYTDEKTVLSELEDLQHAQTAHHIEVGVVQTGEVLHDLLVHSFQTRGDQAGARPRSPSAPAARGCRCRSGSEPRSCPT